jgi:hypothetical protein
MIDRASPIDLNYCRAIQNSKLFAASVAGNRYAG